MNSHSHTQATEHWKHHPLGACAGLLPLHGGTATSKMCRPDDVDDGGGGSGSDHSEVIKMVVVVVVLLLIMIMAVLRTDHGNENDHGDDGDIEDVPKSPQSQAAQINLAELALAWFEASHSFENSVPAAVTGLKIVGVEPFVLGTLRAVRTTSVHCARSLACIGLSCSLPMSAQVSSPSRTCLPPDSSCHGATRRSSCTSTQYNTGVLWGVEDTLERVTLRSYLIAMASLQMCSKNVMVDLDICSHLQQLMPVSQQQM